MKRLMGGSRLTSQIDADNRERDLELQKQKKMLIDIIGTNV
jgi:hypothetical protein